MNPKWAEENLQTIRTLMERSALYRRALAPIMIFCGIVGIVWGIAGWQLQISSDRNFILFWAGAAVLALTRSLLHMRRQALKDSESFWSPPTRRIAQAMLPPFFIGLVVAAVVAVSSPVGLIIGSLVSFSPQGEQLLDQTLLVLVWTWLFGCAIHAAGFFMPRGIKWFGWVFIVAGYGILWLLVNDLNGLGVLNSQRRNLDKISPHLLMGGIFGGFHLIYGIYLYLTEKKNPNA